MKLGISKIHLASVGLLVSGLILSGCTYNRVQLGGGETYSIERVSSTPIYVSWVHAEEKGSELIITGVLGTQSSRARGTGHVDVAVISPEGELLGQTSVDYTPKTVFIESNRRKSRFEARFLFIPPDGSRIRVALHQLSNEKHPVSCMIMRIGETAFQVM